MTATAERNESLWQLVAPPAIWAAHFFASYATAAIWCAKLAGPAGPLGAARLVIAGYTAVALVVLAVLGLRAYRRGTHGGSTGTRHLDSPADRHRFLGFATLLLTGLSALAVAYAALVVVFVETCR